ncbi:PDR/VanB family oxidoreductase [Rubrivivax gelatinosus]|uniref:Oxidoreductase n=1 Tax=Rubrivivax gelatinosus TaxID=28068 RepID=A0ABS1DZQ5_RUBGE|nr:PDR/VanB family oxidoreductase [Rubrivivax gelatinosus]MBK1715043.1 oxidoreductase [Rubrivivax gelatinosus]
MSSRPAFDAAALPAAARGAEIRVRVARRRQESADVVLLDLAADDGSTLPAFAAGAHVELHLPNGLTRQYALCNAPEDSGRYCIAVLRDPASRGGSAWLHDEAAVGQTLRVGPPRSRFALVPAATHHVLVAGGIGIAPLICMAERLAVADASFELHYCARSATRAAFLERMACASWAPRVRLHLLDAPLAAPAVLDPVLDAHPPGSALYVCGPQGFMNWVLGAARAAGWHDRQLHCQHFGAAVTVAPHDADFEVLLAGTGRVVPVARGHSVVQALAAAGVVVPLSCGQGVCGTCQTRVLAGAPEHKDVFLTSAEREHGGFMPCVSRARGARLILDL